MGLEDLDVLQAEIETLLVSVTRRQISIENELDTLVNWHENQTRPGKQQERSASSKSSSPTKTSTETSSSSSMATVSGKRKIIPKDYDSTDHRIKKHQKDSSSSSSMSSSASTLSSASSSIKSHTVISKPAKTKNLPVGFIIMMPCLPFTEVSLYPLNIQNKAAAAASQLVPAVDATEQLAATQFRNDIPDRFCQFIEPYTAPVKAENVKMLEDMLKSYDEDVLAEFMKIPNLGKHYTQKWAMMESDSCWDMKKDNSGVTKGEKKKGLSQSNSADGKGKNKKVKLDSKYVFPLIFKHHVD